MHTTNDAAPSLTRAIVRNLPDNSSLLTGTAAVIWSIAIGFISIPEWIDKNESEDALIRLCSTQGPLSGSKVFRLITACY